MAMGGWVVESLINFTTRGIPQINEATAAVDRLAIAEARLKGEITSQEAQWLNLANAQHRAHSRTAQIVNEIAAGVAVVGVASMGYVADQAAKLQQILISVKNETGATAGQIANIYNDIFNIANQAGMTPIQAGEIFRSVSRMTAGQMSIAQMRSVAPLVADFASTVHFNRPDIDVNSAALTGLSTAHLFRAYTQATLNPLLDKVYRLSGLMGEKPDQALRQMSYYVPMFKGMHIDDEQSIAMMALLDRAGFRNKVGTNVRAMLLEALGPLQMTSHAQKGKLGMLQQMGLLDEHGNSRFDTKTGFNFMGMLLQLSKWEDQMRARGFSNSRIQAMLYGTFGRQGGTIASLMGDRQMVTFLGEIAKYLRDRNVGLAAGRHNRELGLGFQFGRAVGNLQAVLIELGYPWLQDLTNFFKWLADHLHTFQQWLHQNRSAEKDIGKVFAALTGFAAMVAAVGATSQVLMFLGIIKSLPNAVALLVSPFRWLVSALWAISTGGLAAQSAMGAIATALKGWATAGAAFLASPFGLFIAGLIGFSAATTTSAGAGEFKEGDAYWLKHAMTNGWYSMPKTVRDQLYAEGYRPDVSHHDDRHVIHINGPVVVKANDPKHFGHELQKTARHASASQGVLRSLPRVNLGPHAHMLHST